MIRPVSPRTEDLPVAEIPIGPAPARVYGGVFWKAYAANTLAMVAIALLFRYADFVSLLGGTELHLGWIVGVGMIGSLAMRLFLGTAIDRYGPRIVWLGSLAICSLSLLGHLAVSRYDAPGIYLLRIAFCSGIAGIFGASMTYITGRAPLARMAEVLGMLGTSGFVGMVLGTQLGDLLVRFSADERLQVGRMFLVGGVLMALSLGFAESATRGCRRPPPRRRPPMFRLLRRYQPGVLLLVGVVMGVGISMPGTFLRTFAAELNIDSIALFFTVYAPSAIVTRVLTARLPERLGLRPMIFAGLGLLAASQVLLTTVHTPWQFVIPGICYGMAHAVLFPCVIAAGSQRFPTRYRGLGTTLMLATYDLGVLVGAPAAGMIVHVAGKMGLPRYAVMFLAMAVVVVAVGAVYALRREEPTRAVGRPRPVRAPARSLEPREEECVDIAS